MSCDLCSNTTCRSDWSDTIYRVEETSVYYKEGTSYPEGGGGTYYELDICPDCFLNKLIPWAERHGSKASITEWDY